MVGRHGAMNPSVRGIALPYRAWARGMSKVAGDKAGAKLDEDA